MKDNLFYVIENYKGNETVIFSGTERECHNFEVEARANLIEKNGNDITAIHDFYTDSKLEREEIAKKRKKLDEYKKTLTQEQLDEIIEINGKTYAKWIVDFDNKEKDTL